MTMQLNYVPQEAYDRVVDELREEVSVEDIWTEERDEGLVCVVEVHSPPERVEAALASLEADLKRSYPTFRFLVSVSRVGRTSIVHLKHPSGKELTALRGPFDWRPGDVSCLLLSGFSEAPETTRGWRVWFQTLRDQIILEGVSLSTHGSVTRAESSQVRVVHERDPAPA